MKIFIDSANIEDIKRFASFGIVDGVTTNPALIAKEGKDFKTVLKQICDLVNGPISAEVVSTNSTDMVKEARLISRLHENIVVKIPAIRAGFTALKLISEENIKTNFTVVYTANQALLAAKLGATYVSPFVGRLDANSTGGTELIKEIMQIYTNYKFETKVLAASMRNSIYVKEAALAGAHVATIPPNVLDQMLESELSIVALNGFLEEWENMPNEQKLYFK
jgi:transaldolase